MKNNATHRLGNGKIDNAFGKILKLSYGPDKVSESILIPNSWVKCPRYINTFNAQSIPHATKLAGIMYTPLRNFYLFGFILDKLIIPEIAILNWKNTCTAASTQI